MMSELVVNNPNMVIDASDSVENGKFGRRRQSSGPRPENEAALVRQLRGIRRHIEETACSSTWAEDWLYRGATYAPDFKCNCQTCRALFPDRLHPRPVRESNYSLDCQIETNEDPEFAEELARLRNDRPRFGSIFISGATDSARFGVHSKKLKSIGGEA